MYATTPPIPTIDLQFWTNFRREVHQQAELSGLEVVTAKKVADQLRAMGVEVHEAIGGTGVLALFRSQKEGAQLMFRTELDALPIQEINTFAHRSVTDGVSHKCGHDGHLTILMALAARLRQSPPETGTVALLFQPAEETGEGAAAVLADPRFHQLLQPHQVYALHNLPGYPLGHIVIRNGSFTAAVVSRVYRFLGKTAHAAEPEHGFNPARALSLAVEAALQQSRNQPDAEAFSVVTPVHIHLGSKDYGISAGAGELHLTLRCWTQEALDQLVSHLDQAMTQIAAQENLQLQSESLHPFHANENSEEAVQHLREAVAALALPTATRDYPFKWGEDFGLFTQRYSGAMFGIGSGVDSPALHNPDYDFPDELIDPASALFFAIAKRQLG